MLRQTPRKFVTGGQLSMGILYNTGRYHRRRRQLIAVLAAFFFGKEGLVSKAHLLLHGHFPPKPRYCCQIDFLRAAMTNNVAASFDTNSEDAALSSVIAKVQQAKDLTTSESSDTDTTPITSLYVVVGGRGRQILIRREKSLSRCTHEISAAVQHSSYQGAQPLRQKICSYFGISQHTYITAKAELSGESEEYCFLLTLLEVTDTQYDVVAPFQWIDWQKCGDGFDDTCTHPHVARFLKSYLSNVDVDEINLGPTPWRRVGFYNTVLPWLREIISDVGYDMHGRPEQVHFGSLSTVFQIPTSRGFVFFKAGFKGNEEPRKTKAVTKLFPDDTPRLLGVDNGLELMISEDHGPSLNKLYVVKKALRVELGKSDLGSLFSAALTQWARVQKDSINSIQELIDSGIPVYDISWIRAGFLEVVSYIKQTGLDTEYKKVLNFGKYMEKTFKVWDKFNIPDTLVHGDLDGRNIAQPGELGTKMVFFDWDSAFVGHPFLELYRDDTEEVSLGENAYLECWKDYGELESLKRLVLWTKPVRHVIEVVRESRKKIWTSAERRFWVQYSLEAFLDAMDRCDYDKDWAS